MVTLKRAAYFLLSHMQEIRKKRFARIGEEEKRNGALTRISLLRLRRGRASGQEKPRGRPGGAGRMDEIKETWAAEVS
jgi:hypothetical protein